MLELTDSEPPATAPCSANVLRTLCKMGSPAAPLVNPGQPLADPCQPWSKLVNPGPWVRCLEACLGPILELRRAHPCMQSLIMMSPWAVLSVTSPWAVLSVMSPWAVTLNSDTNGWVMQHQLFGSPTLPNSGLERNRLQRRG